jgi:predicted nucleic acid-binding protein
MAERTTVRLPEDLNRAKRKAAAEGRTLTSLIEDRLRLIAVDEAFGFFDDLLGQPHCQLVEPGERHWDIFRRLCIETDIRGSRVSDAWFVALAIEMGLRVDHLRS